MQKKQIKFREIPVKNKEDMFLEVKGIITLIYAGVMNLEDAYRYNNQAEKRIQLRLFKQRRDFFYGQVESNCFTTCEKLRLYQEMYKVCLLILKHENDLYKLSKVITRQTNHYLIQILQRIGKLEDLVRQEQEIRTILNLKKDGLAWLENMRHKSELLLEGIKISMVYHAEQIEKLEKRLLELN